MAKRALEDIATMLELAAQAAAERMRNSRREPLVQWDWLLGPDGLAGVGKTMRMTRAEGGWGRERAGFRSDRRGVDQTAVQWKCSLLGLWIMIESPGRPNPKKDSGGE